MKSSLTLLAFVFSSSLFAGTIKHYTCEAYINTDSINKFAEATGVTVDDIEYALKDKGFVAINFYRGSIKDQMGAGIVESLLDVSIAFKLENKGKGFARYDINEYFAVLGTGIGVNKVESLTVTGKKSLFQTKKKFVKTLGNEIIKQLPDCEIETF